MMMMVTSMALRQGRRQVVSCHVGTDERRGGSLIVRKRTRRQDAVEGRQRRWNEERVGIMLIVKHQDDNEQDGKFKLSMFWNNRTA
jgi:hypothetical protein